MKRLAQLSLSYIVVAVGSALAVSGPVVYPLLVVTTIYLMQAVLIVAAVCCIGSIIALTYFWTRGRVTTIQVEQRIDEETLRFAYDMGKVSPPKVGNESHLWNLAYKNLIFLGKCKRTLSLKQMVGYFEKNGQRYWKWMVDELKRNGLAEVRDGTTKFTGSYVKACRQLEKGELVLRPHPKLTAPPVVWLWIEGLDKDETPEKAETLEMVVVEGMTG